MAGRSQHKEVFRRCPSCGKEKLFPARNKTCGPDCRYDLDSKNKASGNGPERRAETIDSLHIELDGTPIRSLDALLKHCAVDTSVWEVDRFICNKWSVAMKQVDAVTTKTKINRVKQTRRTETVTPITTDLYQVKAWFRKKVSVVDARAELAALKSDMLADARRAKIVTMPLVVQRAPKVASSKPSGIMTEFSLPDPHFGKLCWSHETGYRDYDMKLALRDWDCAMETLKDRVRPYRPDEITFVLGNDLLHYDNREQQTTHGTRQDSDTRYQQVFRAVRQRVMGDIRRFRSFTRHVKVVLVPGNHDTLSVWHLGDSLEIAYAGEGDVTVDNKPRLRKYVQWGAAMLMFTHGDKGKRADYPLLMATERPTLWGQSKFREAHLGHIHQVRLEEKHGVRVRVLPSLCPPDAWHSENMYVGNLQSAEAYSWDKEMGLVDLATYCVPDQGPLQNDQEMRAA